MKLLITCPFWFSVALSREIKVLWYMTYDTFDTGTYCDTDLKGMCYINLRSRIANKVYIVLWKNTCSTFDQLFEIIKNVDWKKYLCIDSPISISVYTNKSMLTSIKTIQSVSHKSIINSLVGIGWKMKVDENKESIEILVSIYKDIWQILINTSWRSLHNRWYRTKQWEAPLKENIAAGLILTAGRHFKKKFLDPFCWSGTLCIEAAMIARNIAPWLYRHFSFESFPYIVKDLFTLIKEEATEKIFKRKYSIIWTDIDANMIDICRSNAINANVDDTIIFEKKNILDYDESFDGHIVTNPPYGKRINPEDISFLYKKLELLLRLLSTWGFITSRDWVKKDIKFRKTKEINNNKEKCTFFLKR